MIPFRLPDLGEGLHEVEIVEWHVKAGEEVAADQPLVSVETDKAIVDIPSPRSGRIARLKGDAGDIVPVGATLVEFEGDESEAPPAKTGRADTGTVVGEVTTGDEVIVERPSAPAHGDGAGVKAMPAVRALAKRLDVELAIVTPSGPDGLITSADVQRVAKLFAELGPLERIRGPRRAMARRMSAARDEIAAAMVCDDADVGDWVAGADVTIRLVRAIVAGIRAAPALNAWYDPHAVGRRVIKRIDLGMAVDTEEGLFVPVLHDVGARDAPSLREGLDRLKADVRARSIPPEQMRGYTFTLSNFGTIAGRYAMPMLLPPTVGILGAGVIRPEVRARDGVPAVRRVLPLSLTFDHRAVTGGEAGRFLGAAIADLQQAE